MRRQKSRKKRKSFCGGIGSSSSNNDHNSYNLDNGGLWKVYLPPFTNMNLVREQTIMLATFLLQKMSEARLIYSAQFDSTRIQEILSLAQTNTADTNVLKTNFLEIQLMYCIYFNFGKSRGINLLAMGSVLRNL